MHKRMPSIDVILCSAATIPLFHIIYSHLSAVIVMFITEEGSCIAAEMFVFQQGF